jgi:hypothetical protein
VTVYVDDARIPARVAGLSGRWSHLIADTPEELHAFAERLGFKRAWFQDPTVNGKPVPARPGTRAAENWHYDVTDFKRQQAIMLGAVPVTMRELPGIIEARWQAQRAVSVDPPFAMGAHRRSRDAGLRVTPLAYAAEPLPGRHAGGAGPA